MPGRWEAENRAEYKFMADSRDWYHVRGFP